MSRVTSANSRNDIKPSDVYEIKLKTQQLRQQTRQTRTQLSRAQDRINSQTNAINKTFEQSSDQPPVATNHSNTVPQLQRSVESAQNTLDSLKNEIEKTRKDDKTFSVRELQEEVKIIYCEYTRLNKEVADGQEESQAVENARSQAEMKCSSRYQNSLKAQINELKSAIIDLNDKSNAYASKNAKLESDKELVKELGEQNQPVTPKSGKQQTQRQQQQPKQRSAQQIKKESDEKKAQIQTEIDEETEKLKESHKQHEESMNELRQIIEAMKEKIVEQLQNPKPKETAEKKEEEEDKQDE